MVSKRRAPAREIFGWAMFDFANQAYTLLIITVVFGDLFTRVIVGDGPDYRLGNLLWSLALAASYFLVVVSGPVCGAVMDYSRTRKLFLFVSYLLTITATALLYFVQPGWIVLAMTLIIISNFAYAMGENFIASFLPDLGPRKDLGWISGLGWSLGYIGGMIATAFTLLVLGEVEADNFERLRWVGPFAAGFFLLAALPTFFWLKDRGRRRALPAGSSYAREGFARLRETALNLRQFRDLSILLVSIFFAMAGIYIIISFSFIYGSQVIGWEDHVRAIMFVTVQFTAAAGALGFGWLQSRIGARTTYMMTLTLWMAAIIAIWQTPNMAALARSLWAVDWEAQYVFLFAGVLAGLSLGAAQSAGRALVGVLTPRGKAAEFFGFWGFSAKLAAIFGILGLGLIQAWLGLANAILFCLSLFILAFLFAIPINEQRGQSVAENWREEKPS